MGFFRAVWILTEKDLKIVAWRRCFSTLLRALVLPIAYILFISYARDFFLPPSRYGIGEPRPIRDITTEVFNSSTSLGGRNRIAFINNGNTGGQIDTLIGRLTRQLEPVGVDVRTLASEDGLLQVCQSSLAGFSRCYASASFTASPSEGPGNNWAYTARVDAGLGLSVFVNADNNAAQVYVLPFVQAIDAEIARMSGTSLPNNMFEQPFTYETIQDRNNLVQSFFMRALANYLAVTLFIAICGISFHLPGYLAVEREAGLSSLIDVMSHDARAWITLTTRLASNYISFAIIYLPGWIAIGAIVSQLIFFDTSAGIVIPFHLLLGFAMTGYSLFLGSFFKKAQLSGITVLLLSLITAIVAQFVPRNQIAIGVLAAVFPPATYTFFAIQLAEYGDFLEGASLTATPPYIGIHLPGFIFFIFLAAQIVYYPLLAAIVQRAYHGTSRKSTNINDNQSSSVGLRLIDACKTFGDSFSDRLLRRDLVRAVDHLSLSIPRGQLVALLGVNGSGKSTLISGITGTQSFTSGQIELPSKQNIGWCPQTNVAWDDLTVYENVRLFSRLKTSHGSSKKDVVTALISACDLGGKLRSKPQALSGGQRRKLQLALAFAGDSALCLIDEASSGLDPLSRRKIWEILLAERGRRTIIFTTHALDEADALPDHIAIMSTGHLVAQGSAAEIKHKYGNGYTIEVPSSDPTDTNNETITVTTSKEACEVVRTLESQGRGHASVRGPGIEDVFLSIARDNMPVSAHSDSQDSLVSDAIIRQKTAHRADALQRQSSFHNVPGKGTSFIQQVGLLFGKRALIFRRNYMPYICAIAVPVIVAGVGGMYFLRGFYGIPCSLGANVNNPQSLNLGALQVYWGIQVPVGPISAFSRASLPSEYARYQASIQPVANYRQYQNYIATNFRNVVPGGLYLGYNQTNDPLISYRINGNLGYAALAKNMADSYLMGQTINAQFSTFALPFGSSTGNSLQFILYISLAMCAYPAFLALYPTLERLRHVKALQYSSGVRPAPLWLAYWLFDGIIVVLISVAVIALLTNLSSALYAPIGLFFAILLYGLSALMLAYVVSTFAKTQLAAFAVVAGYLAVSLLIYFVAYMVLLTFGTAERLQNNLEVVQFTYGLLTPSGTLLRVFLLALNQSQLLCRGQNYVSFSADITVYGGAYLYFILQIFASYAFLVAHDSGFRLPFLSLLSRFKTTDSSPLDGEKHPAGLTPDVQAEATRTRTSKDELRILNLTKSFSHHSPPVVDNTTFGVDSGEALALLGPNGAGKTTTIGLVRGTLKPSTPDSEILISNHSIRTAKLAARNHLGVCPQFNAIDRLTVREHLTFYARIRGVPSTSATVSSVLAAVGLPQYANRFVSQLSGGNQRKLSLATAIVGNPTVVLLDEPSSGMDALAMRSMWRAIQDVRAQRAVVVTTHSMEEAGALASRVAIMDRRLLAIGKVAELVERCGRGVYGVQIVGGEDVEQVKRWVIGQCEGAREREVGGVGARAMHGQVRFQVVVDEGSGEGKGLVRLLELLEESKARFGVEYYSLSPMTLEDVFLEIVAR